MELIRSVDLENKGVIKVLTINKVSIYVIYTLQKTIKEILQKFEENYHCNSPFYYYSQSSEKVLEEHDYYKTPMELKMNKIEEVNLVTHKNSHVSEENSYRKESKIGYQIFIKNLLGKTLTIKVESYYTIGDIKSILTDLTGIPISEQRLVFAGCQYDNHYTMTDCGVTKECTIHLTMRLKGGMYAESSGKAGNFEPLKSCVIYVE